ncbi:hypothetical protein [uncultured Roseovarius sp.]|uniref:anti-sigma factor family protein n=1 Tax=uncultured Roseovarius sp. TaxID=293344 RepID=UPI00262A0876|nr:hypothetical protein [uncultured Roseovarius sp.]
MTDRNVFSDQDLSCYLDGETSGPMSEAIDRALATDPALRQRLAELKAGEEAFAAAMVAAAQAAPAMPEIAQSLPVPANRPLRAGLAGVAVGAVAAIGLAWNLWQTPEADWHDVVANYQSLYVTETLAQVDLSPAAQKADLDRLSKGLGIDLTVLPQVAGLSFKRAQQLGYRGKPLAQLTFLTADGGPVALCIIETGSETSDAINAAVLSGLDTYSWTDNGFGVLLVGPKGQKGLENAAEMFRSALKDAAV